MTSTLLFVVLCLTVSVLCFRDVVATVGFDTALGGLVLALGAIHVIEGLWRRVK